MYWPENDDIVCITVRGSLSQSPTPSLLSTHTYADCRGAVQDGIHELSCRYSRGYHSWHATLNDIIKHSLDATKFLSHLEPLSLYSVGQNALMELQLCHGKE